MGGVFVLPLLSIIGYRPSLRRINNINYDKETVESYAESLFCSTELRMNKAIIAKNNINDCYKWLTSIQNKMP